MPDSNSMDDVPPILPPPLAAPPVIAPETGRPPAGVSLGARRATLILLAYRRSFGAAWAAITTIGIFVALHLPETIHFTPASIGIAGLAATALWMRLRTGAIGPAIAVHFAYNLVIASTVLVAR